MYGMFHFSTSVHESINGAWMLVGPTAFKCRRLRLHTTFHVFGVGGVAFGPVCEPSPPDPTQNICGRCDRMFLGGSGACQTSEVVSVKKTPPLSRRLFTLDLSPRDHLQWSSLPCKTSAFRRCLTSLNEGTFCFWKSVWIRFVWTKHVFPAWNITHSPEIEHAFLVIFFTVFAQLSTDINMFAFTCLVTMTRGLPMFISLTGHIIGC